MVNITTVIVTHNRKALLKTCLSALTSQTRASDAIVVVDNASTDGTPAWFQQWRAINLPQAQLVSLKNNIGGAGGFYEGMRTALYSGADWIWVMDDDAAPHVEALSELMQVATDPRNIYGSLAIHDDQTSWLMTLLGDFPKTVSRVCDVPPQADVSILPFLGLLIHRHLVEKIGLPDPDFFIAADDVEYCIRAKKTGARLIVAGKSHIEHPKSRPYEIRLPGRTLTALELPPLKRYYDTRNRLLIARKHYGMKYFTQAVLGLIARMIAALLKEPRKSSQLKAFVAGFVDGLLGRKGRRHEAWGIK